MESFEKSLALLQANHSIKCNIVSNRTCLSIPKNSSIPKVCTQNTSSIKTDFEDFKSNFMETLNVQTELFMNQQKELFFTKMNSFKNELLTSLKHNTKSHSHEPSNNTDRIIFLLQDQIEFLQEQLKSKDKIINSLIENLSRNDDVLFSQKTATLKTPANQTNYKQLQNTKNMESKESQNKNTPRCFCNKEKESQEDKQVEDISKKANKNMAIVRSLDNSCNPQKTITADDHKNDKPKGEKNKNSIFVIGDSMVKHLNGSEMSKKLNASCKVFFKTFSGAKTTCMNDYVKPSVRISPDHFILHVGTNDLSSDKSSEEITRSIIGLATSIKNEKHDVSISNIIIRADDKKLGEKRCEVNSFLGKLCKEKNYYLIDHSTRNHLNKGKLHLNQKGTNLLSDIFVKDLSKIFN